MIRFNYFDIQAPIFAENGEIVDLTIENKTMYRTLALDLLHSADERASFYNDGKILDLKKNIVVIDNLLELNPNSKKILTSIYKKIDRVSLTPERREKFDKINAQIAELLQDIASDFEGSIIFNDSFELLQLLGQFDFKFDYDDSNFVTCLISFLKAYREATDLKAAICFNLFACLEEKQIEQLKSELGYIGIPLLNISYIYQKRSGIKHFIVDDDLCEIDG